MICACSVLVDEAATKTGDLYIRSVCFSPDGKYLATGAEDKQIRVRPFLPGLCVIVFDIADIYGKMCALLYVDLGHCQAENSALVRGSHAGDLLP